MARPFFRTLALGFRVYVGLTVRGQGTRVKGFEVREGGHINQLYFRMIRNEKELVIPWISWV